MKIAYFGLPLASLLLLSDGHDLALTVISPLAAPGLRRLTRLLGSERVIWGSEQNSGQISGELRRVQPDLIVSWFFTRLIPESWLSLALHGGIGAHPSLLPRHRGPNPFFWSIDQGDSHSGISIHRLRAEYDTGAIVAQHRTPIGDRNAWQLARHLDRSSLMLLRDTVRRISQQEPLHEIAQDETQASWAGEPTGALLTVDWRWPVARVLRRIRALSPVPGLALELHGLRFFVTQAGLANTALLSLEPGEAAVARENGGLQLLIRAADGAVAIQRAALEAGDSAPELAEGQPVTATELCQALLRRAPQMVSSIVEPEAP